MPHSLETLDDSLRIYNEVQSTPANRLNLVLPQNPHLFVNDNIRPNSESYEDLFFGDSGKGSMVTKANRRFVHSHGRSHNLRGGGSANAGHETMDEEGNVNVSHLMPVGVTQDNTVGIMSRGMAIHLLDASAELNALKDMGRFRGDLWIDKNGILLTDAHRAFEPTLSEYSTGKGVAPAYMDFYGKNGLFIHDILEGNWDRIQDHYERYRRYLLGFGKDLADIEVSTHEKGIKRKVGSFSEFSDRLKTAVDDLKPYIVDNLMETFEEIWMNPHMPVVFEGAQGDGIDPWHGVYRDVTASRTMSHNLNDSTYGIVDPHDIAVRAAVMKTSYMSEVGSRKLPQSEESRERNLKIQKDFDEFGRTTGNPRNVHPPSIPIAVYMRRAAGFKYIAASHLDASSEGETFEVVVGYKDKATGKERPYSPFQKELDKLVPVTVTFDGWDGDAVKKAKDPDEFPDAVKTYLSFLSRAIAPVAYATSGPEISNSISFLPNS